MNRAVFLAAAKRIDAEHACFAGEALSDVGGFDETEAAQNLYREYFGYESVQPVYSLEARRARVLALLFLWHIAKGKP